MLLDLQISYSEEKGLNFTRIGRIRAIKLLFICEDELNFGNNVEKIISEYIKKDQAIRTLTFGKPR